MIQGFPRRLLKYVRCTKDGGRLVVVKAFAGNDQAILHGSVKCAECATPYEIREGILDMFFREKLTNEFSQYEMDVRDREAETISEQWEQSNAIGNEMEIPSTLKRLGRPLKIGGCDILELGCGTGRYSKLLAQKVRFVLAVDFSWQSLIANSRRLDNTKNVGLLHADVSQLKLQPESFDLALSTFYSNLPTYEIRVSSTRIVAEGLKRGGRYVLSAHNHHPLEILKGIPASRTYDNGMVYRCFTVKSFRKKCEIISLILGQPQFASGYPYSAVLRKQESLYQG